MWRDFGRFNRYGLQLELDLTSQETFAEAKRAVVEHVIEFGARMRV